MFALFKQIMCAMSRPQLSGKTVTSRFLRHFNVLSIDEFSNDMLKSIFSKIVLWHLDARYLIQHLNNFFLFHIQSVIK